MGKENQEGNRGFEMKEFLISFTGEIVNNPEFKGYFMGRVTIHHKIQKNWGEIRFFTKKKSWHKFREKHELVWVTKKQLNKIVKIIEGRYQEKI